MKIVKAKLFQRIKRTSDIESFRFHSYEKVDFTPGQFLQIIFDEDNKDNGELNKYLSFSSSSTKKYIQLTKRLSESMFSQKLKNLKIDDEVLFKAPLGNCIFKNDYKKIGFLIGGIGITPVISIIEYIVDKKMDTDVSLFYSNKGVEDIAFRKELDSWQANNRNIKIFYTITDGEVKDDRYFSGRINKDLLMNSAKDLNERIIFSFGPPKMVEAMKNICIEIGCVKESIKTESFIGY